jgi:predicted metal-dependent phosphoesterase TrpH
MEKWLLADLHIHSTLSDGSMPVEEIVKIYGEAGFDVIAITEHLFDTQSPRSLEIHEEGKSIKDVEAYFQKIEEVSQWAKQTFGLLVIPGLEICNLSEDYHILGIDLKEGVNPNQDAVGVIKEIHRQGGLAIASHPPLKLSYFLNEDRESIHRILFISGNIEISIQIKSMHGRSPIVRTSLKVWVSKDFLISLILISISLTT